MVKSGFPLYIVGLAFVTLIGLNRMIIAYKLDALQLVYFSLAFLVFYMLYFLPESVRSVLFIKMGEDIGSGPDAMWKLERDARLTSRLIALLMPILVVGAIALVAWFVPLVLPKYIPGIAPTAVYILGAVY